MEKCISHFRGGFAPNLSAVLIGVPVIVFMCLYPKKWNAVVPSSLVAIVLATAALGLGGAAWLPAACAKTGLLLSVVGAAVGVVTLVINLVLF